MAATATQQIINNGTRNLVLKYTISGASGDAAAVKLVDVSALDSTIGVGGLRLERATWALTGLSCKLSWDGGPDVDLLEMSDGDGKVDYSDIGGITNNATQQSGDVLFTTDNYTASGDGGHFILEFKKKSGTDLSDASPPTGSIGFTGNVPVISILIDVPVGSVSFTGNVPTIP